MKIAIVADWIYGGGAEKVVQELHRMYPDAPIYTSYCSPEWRQKLDNKVVTGYLQWRPFARLRKFLPLLRQWWFRGLNLRAYDVVISCTGNGEAKFVRVRPGTRHICYCFTPTHFYWRKYPEYIQNPGFGALNGIARTGLKLLVGPLKKRDYAAAQRVDQFVAISTHIQHDIQKYYDRASQIIHPPAHVTSTRPSNTESPAKTPHAIVWGRLVPYKRLDLAVAACNELQMPLTIIGSGPDASRLKSIAGPTITFTGFVPDNKLPALAQKASVFVFPSQEDFGIAPVEAMGMGLPVLAYKSGGALDYVIPGKTGEFFDKQTVASLAASLKQFRAKKYDRAELVDAAKQFSQDVFQDHMRSLLSK